MKRTIVDRIEIDRNHDIGIRLAFEMVDDTDGEVVPQGMHRIQLIPGDDLVAKVQELNANLTAMKRVPLATADRNRIKKVTDAYWTQAVIDAATARRAAAAANAPGTGG